MQVVIEFVVPESGPCKLVQPVFAACADRYHPNAVFLKVEIEDDIGDLHKVAASYSVKSFPTHIFVINGKVADSVSGPITEPAFNQIIDKYLAEAQGKSKIELITEEWDHSMVFECAIKEEFDSHMRVVDTDQLVVIEFVVPGSGTCKLVQPVFAACARRHPGTVFLKVEVEDDIGDLHKVAASYSVKSFPTHIFVMNGKVVDTVSGPITEPAFNQIIDKYLAAAAAATSTA
ncbi:hypothetical protein EJB05_15516 [Eragrostis curvula]|uniref:Thioredoxin domain-containing protein n=1 Tax=Eragrostis curvula TaxID=38414 RepID=A0A5J9W380_9POAL|nr:hypothetical protein EJB05_15516 [Eragrostis curvula]